MFRHAAILLGCPAAVLAGPASAQEVQTASLETIHRLWVFNVFIQDRFALLPELTLILGLKAERTSFAGVELLPNVRIAWQPNARTLWWGAVSRAVRTPSRIDRQLANLPLLAPADDFVSEKLVALEAGYPGRPSDWMTLSVSAIFNRYDDIRTAEFTGDPLPIQLRNGLRGHAYGVEAWSALQPVSWWRLSLGLATLWKDFELEPGRIDLAQRDALGHDPDYQLLGRSHFALTDRLELNAGLRWVGDLGSGPGPGIGDYVEADARLAYWFSEDLELYLTGRNLLHRTLAESDDIPPAQISQRSLYVGTRVQF